MPTEKLNPVDKAIKNRKETYHGIYADIGVALEGFTTEDLASYFIQKFGGGSLRYFLEQQIIAAEINKSRKY